MRWLKREKWKAGIALAGMLLLLVLMVWVPVSAAGAYERASGLATPVTGTAQATPTEDATMTTLNKEKLAQEVQQLKNQNETDLFIWLRTNASVLFVVIGGLIGLWRWLGDRRSERGKRVEEQFQSAVTGLGDEKEGAKISAVIRLRTFLRPGYEQYYTQIFNLAVANLRLPRTPPPPDDPDGIPHSPADPNTPQPLTPLSQALIAVFTEAFPLVRDELKKREKESFDRRSLDASYIHLDKAFLWKADLEQVYMPWATLQGADLSVAKLDGVALWEADLSRARLSGASLNEADLGSAILREADLRGASLSKAILSKTILREAKLMKADLRGADLRQAQLDGAILREADLREAELGCGLSRHGNPLSGAILSRADLREVRNLEYAQSLKDTILRGVTGLTKEQLEVCKAKGAIIDEDATPSPPQSPVSPSAPSQSNDAQAPSAPSAQGSTPTPNTDGSSTTSSQSGTES